MDPHASKSRIRQALFKGPWGLQPRSRWVSGRKITKSQRWGLRGVWLKQGGAGKSWLKTQDGGLPWLTSQAQHDHDSPGRGW